MKMFQIKFFFYFWLNKPNYLIKQLTSKNNQYIKLIKIKDHILDYNGIVI